MSGQIWPEAVGKPLSITYITTSRIASLVEKEQGAGRARLELTAYLDKESSEWEFDLSPPSAGLIAARGRLPQQTGNAAVPRGLASSIPIQARPNNVTSNPFPLGRPDQPPVDPNIAIARARGNPLHSPQAIQGGSRLFQQSQLGGGGGGKATVTTATGEPIHIPANSGFAQTRTIKRERDDTDKERIWQPASGSDSIYKKTENSPQLWYKPVDLMSAGRKLREMEQEHRRNNRGRGSGSGSGMRMPRGVRDTYRP